MPRLAVLASGSGTNLQALFDAIAAGGLAAEIAVVVSNRPRSGALQRAAAAGVPGVSLPLANRRDVVAREAYDRLLADVVAAFAPDLIVLAGWMLILSPAFLDRFPHRIVNIHPALLPADGSDEVASSHGPLPALRGPRVVRDALAQRLPVTGATTHWVTATVDRGPVILREEVTIAPDDDEARLHERIKHVEHRLLPRAVALALREITKRDCCSPSPGSTERGLGGEGRASRCDCHLSESQAEGNKA
jgi:phosphoribosylglycinamide formyltransferase-1